MVTTEAKELEQATYTVIKFSVYSTLNQHSHYTVTDV